MGCGGSDGRGATPLVGNLLLVAVALVVAVLLTVLAFSFLEGLGAPTADAKFEYEQTPVGLEMTPVALGTDVVVKLNGRDIASIDADSAGEPVLVPTAPGDRITVVSRDEDKAVLVEETIDDRSEIGDFIAYYTFSEGTGSTLVDRSGNGNDGTLKGDPTWVSNGLRFDGTDDYVTVADISAPVDVTEFTVAVAYRQRGPASSGEDASQLIEHTDSNNNEWFLETSKADQNEPYTNEYSVDYAVRYPTDVVSSGAVKRNTRHVVVGTYDGNEYELYVDGAFAGRGTHSQPVEMGDLRIARDFESDIQYLDGDIYEIRLYYAAFDGEQVDTITKAMS